MPPWFFQKLMETKSIVPSLFIASDHAGFKVKKKLIEDLSREGFSVLDLGTHTENKVDYPDLADKLCEKITNRENSKGILICGSGQGMAMRANKYPSIRAALCWDEDSARLSRKHNKANVLCLGARLLNKDSFFKISKIFLNTKFEGGHHQPRVEKLSKSTEKKFS